MSDPRQLSRSTLGPLTRKLPSIQPFTPPERPPLHPVARTMSYKATIKTPRCPPEPENPLAGTPYENQTERIERLSGGYSAFTYRLYLKHQVTKAFLEPSPKTVIAKVFLPLLSGTVKLGLGPERMLYESEALEALGGKPQRYGRVSIDTSEFLFAQQNPGKSVLIMSDAGPLPTLKEWFSSDPCQNLDPDLRAELCRDIGRALAGYLKSLHEGCNVVGSPQALLKTRPLAAAKGTKGLLKFIYYDCLPESCPDADPATLEVIRRAAAVGAREMVDLTDVLVHGDFGPRNMLIDASDTRHVKLRVIDWELNHQGSASVDVGQCIAESLCIKTFCEPTCGNILLSSFLEAYGITSSASTDTSKVDIVQVARRVAAGILSLAHQPALGYVGQGNRKEAEEDRMVEEVRAWAIELLKCTQLEDTSQAREVLLDSSLKQ